MSAEPLGGALPPVAVSAAGSDGVGIGVIGTGTIAGLHLAAYRADPGARLVAVCDLNGERAATAAATFGAESWVTDYRELLADDRIQAVSICTRNDTHAELAVAALEAGKHVLVEKPIGRTVAEVETILEAERRSAGTVMVGFVRRFSGNARVLKSFIDAGELGELYHAKATCLRRAGNPGGWFADRTISGGGPLVDIGVHFIDIAWWLLGAPEVATVSGFTFERLGNRNNVQHLSRYLSADAGSDHNAVEDLAGGLVRFTNGAVLQIDTSYSVHGRDQVGVVVHGDQGGAELEPELKIVTEQHDTILEMTPQMDSLTFDGQPAFAREIAEFLATARGEQPSPAPAAHGLVVTRIIEAIYESARLGREIAF